MARRDRSTGWGVLGLALLFALGITSTAAAQDSDGDGLGDAIERSLGDTDQDQRPDYLDRDDDGDELDTSEELGDDATNPRDSDADGKPDYRDFDDDNDGVSTLDERSTQPGADADNDGIVAYLDGNETGPYIADADRDGILDAVDSDDDDDGVPDERERPGATDIDTDGDGRIDRFDVDDDGDGIPTKSEQPNPAPGRDTDGDGKVDYIDADDDGDGLPTRDEEPDPNHDGMIDDARVTSGSTPDYLNEDDDRDEVKTRDERPNGTSLDTDGDRLVNHLDRDDDGDGRDTAYEVMLDSDRDGTLDYLDSDDDGDGILTLTECSGVLLLDFDSDDLLNCLDLDSDSDGKSDAEEGVLDRDGNGAPDYLDAPTILNDLDNDGVSDARECPPASATCPDTDGDGKVDSADPDDDGDGLATRDESGQTARDTDRDDVPDYLDSEDDGDLLPTMNELHQGAPRDTDRDEKPDHLDADDDGDGIATRDEGAPARDTDGDGIPDYLDARNDVIDDAGTSTADAGGVDAGRTAPTVVPVDDKDDGCSVSPSRTRRPPWLWMSGLLLFTFWRRRSYRVLIRLFGAALAIGCSDDDDPTDVTIVGDASLDASARLDSGSLRDAGDAALEDGQVDSGFGSECAGDLLRFSSIRGEGRSFSATIDGNRTHLTFLVPACGDVSSVEGARNLRYLTFATSGAASDPSDLLPDGCATPRDPTLVSSSSGIVSLFYGALGEEGFELVSRSPAASGQAQVQTTSSGQELSTVGRELTTDELATVAYAVQNPTNRLAPTSIETLQIGRAPTELLPASAGQRVARLGLSAIGGSVGEVRGLVAWLSDSTSAPGLFARLVNARGTGQGELLALSTATSGESSLAVTTRKTGAAVIYTELGNAGYELRFRALSASGELGGQVALTGANERVGEVAIAAHRNGYAVAYRRLASESNATPSVRLLFIDEAGHIGGTRFVANARATGSALTLLSALDGRLIVLWDDVVPMPDAGAPTTLLDLQAARLTCN